MKSFLGLAIILGVLIFNVNSLPATTSRHTKDAMTTLEKCPDCLNGGSCLYTNNTSYCECVQCFSGLRCETSEKNINYFFGYLLKFIWLINKKRKIFVPRFLVRIMQNVLQSQVIAHLHVNVIQNIRGFCVKKVMNRILLKYSKPI